MGIDEVVLRVRASRPSFWVGQTYDYWNGQSWVQAADPANGGSAGGHLTKLDYGSPFEIPLQPNQEAPLADATTIGDSRFLVDLGMNNKPSALPSPRHDNTYALTFMDGHSEDITLRSPTALWNQVTAAGPDPDWIFLKSITTFSNKSSNVEGMNHPKG